MRPVDHKSEIVNGSWLPDMDLNHDKQIQSLLCYRYTIGQTEASHRLVNSAGQSSWQPKRGATGRVGQRAEVAQVGNRLFRRLAVGWPRAVVAAADCQSAIRQTSSPRYGLALDRHFQAHPPRAGLDGMRVFHARPHPGPLPRGEGETLNDPRKLGRSNCIRRLTTTRSESRRSTRDAHMINNRQMILPLLGERAGVRAVVTTSFPASRITHHASRN